MLKVAWCECRKAVQRRVRWLYCAMYSQRLLGVDKKIWWVAFINCKYFIGIYHQNEVMHYNYEHWKYDLHTIVHVTVIGFCFRTLYMYTLISVCIFSILFSVNFLRRICLTIKSFITRWSFPLFLVFDSGLIL